MLLTLAHLHMSGSCLYCEGFLHTCTRLAAAFDSSPIEFCYAVISEVYVISVLDLGHTTFCVVTKQIKMCQTHERTSVFPAHIHVSTIDANSGISNPINMCPV